MKTLNVGIGLVLLALISMIATHTPLMHEATVDADMAAAAAIIPTASAAPTKEANPSYYLPSEHTDAERNAPESGEPAPTF